MNENLLKEQIESQDINQKNNESISKHPQTPVQQNGPVQVKENNVLQITPLQHKTEEQNNNEPQNVHTEIIQTQKEEIMENNKDKKEDVNKKEILEQNEQKIEIPKQLDQTLQQKENSHIDNQNLLENPKKENSPEKQQNNEIQVQEDIIQQQPVKPEPIKTIQAEIQKIQTPEKQQSNQKMQIEEIKLPSNQNQQSQKQIQPKENQVYCFGNAEADQFYINGIVFEVKKPFKINFFFDNKIKVQKLVCGSQHTALLSETGDIYTWGNNDSGAVGRNAKETAKPGRVELSEKVDMLSAGESHTICANSQKGNLHFFGKLKSQTETLLQTKEPVKYSFYRYKKGITDIQSGSNHILVLVNKRVYSFGDHSHGALGNVFKKERDRVDFLDPTCVNVRNVSRIFTGHHSSFIATHKNDIYAFGLNNYQQLGFESEDENNFVEKLPIKWTEIKADQISDIKAGEHHTLVLFKNGDVYGAGRNDDGQLGKLDMEADEFGSFRKLNHLPKLSKILCASHFNYGLNKEETDYYAWGFGYGFVLGNGQEETVEEAWKINNEKVFKDKFPSMVALGDNSVSFVTGELGDIEELRKNVWVPKKRVKKRKLVNDEKTNQMHMTKRLDMSE